MLNVLINFYFERYVKYSKHFKTKMSHLLSNLQKDTNSPFNTIEDSGIDAKFVNVVYDALLNTVSRRIEFMFDNLTIISSKKLSKKQFIPKVFLRYV